MLVQSKDTDLDFLKMLQTSSTVTDDFLLWSMLANLKKFHIVTTGIRTDALVEANKKIDNTIYLIKD